MLAVEVKKFTICSNAFDTQVPVFIVYLPCNGHVLNV